MSVQAVLSGEKRWHVEASDVTAFLRSLPEGCVQVCITSPPYWQLRSYLKKDDPLKPLEIGQEPTPDAYVERLVGVFREVRRVLADHGTLWVNVGDSYAGSSVSKNSRPGEFLSHHASGRSSDGERNRNGIGSVAGLKPLDQCCVPHRLYLALIADGWYGRADCVWCLSAGTMVYARTQKGDMPMTIKDMVRLRPETVQLWNGEKWTRVVGWTKRVCPKTTQERRKASNRRRQARYAGKPFRLEEELEIQLRNGQRIGCTAEHLWPTQRGNVRSDELRIGDVIRTTTLPEPESPDAPAMLPDEEIGWLVGFYLAEGYMEDDHVGFSVHINEDAEFGRLAAIAAKYHGVCRRGKLKGNGAVITIYGQVVRSIIKEYVHGKGSHNKKLKTACWQRSNVFLRALLQGYLDGDGHYDEKNDRWRIGYCDNHALTSDLRTLAARVGAFLNVKRTRHKYQGGHKPGYRGEVRFTKNEHWNSKDRGEVVAIHAGRGGIFWDIEVEDEPHLFALASGVLTHNSKTSAMPISVRGWRWEKCRVKTGGGWTKDTHPAAVGANGGRGEGIVSGGVATGKKVGVAEWSDCPGCKKCERAGGLVLRKGSWRPTSAHEYLFLLARSPNYFMDGDAVRTPLSPVTVQRDQYSRVLDDPDEQCAVAHDHETVGNPSGANPRDVFRHDATAADVFAWLADQDPALGEALHQKWREQQGMHDVLWVGPEPLKAAHYAAFPTALVTPLLRASTSERGQCPACGMPWARVIDRPVTKRNGDVKPNERDGGLTAQHGLERTGMSHYAYDQWLKDNPTKTVGWKASCECAGDPVPQIVLDPFAGSGRTGMAARRLGLRFLGCELNSEFAELANAQIAADAIDVPLAQGKAGPSLFDALEGRP